MSLSAWNTRSVLQNAAKALPTSPTPSRFNNRRLYQLEAPAVALSSSLNSLGGFLPAGAGVSIRSMSNMSKDSVTSGRPTKRILYEGHIPITPWQRVALAGWSAISSLRDPARADMVAALGEVTGELAIKHLHRCMLADPEGRAILRARPVINEATVDLAALEALPEGTFGKGYANFMSRHGFSPDSRSPVHFVDDPDLAYVMRRYREVHDLWHVLSGLPPSLEGELALKWLELVQTGLPMCGLAAVFGSIALPGREPRFEHAAPHAPLSEASKNKKRQSGSREVLARVYIPWALRVGRLVRKPLICVWYERHWEKTLENVREELGLAPAPLRGTI